MVRELHEQQPLRAYEGSTQQIRFEHGTKATKRVAGSWSRHSELCRFDLSPRSVDAAAGLSDDEDASGPGRQTQVVHDSDSDSDSDSDYVIGLAGGQWRCWSRIRAAFLGLYK